MCHSSVKMQLVYGSTNHTVVPTALLISVCHHDEQRKNVVTAHIIHHTLPYKNKNHQTLKSGKM